MPILTRRSCASTFQEVFARLSKTHANLVSLMAQKVWRLLVSVFVVHDRHSHAGNCTGLPSNISLILSTCIIHLFLLQRHLIPFDSLPLLLFRFSRVWRQNFATWVSDLYFSAPSFSISDNWASISFDESPCRTFLIRFWVDQTHVSQFVQTFQNIIGIFEIDSKTSSHPVSNSWALSSRRVTKNKSA